MLAMKHGDGSVVVWRCSVIDGPCQLTVTESTMIQGVLYKNMRPSVNIFLVNENLTLEHDNDLKETSKSTKNWLRIKT